MMKWCMGCVGKEGEGTKPRELPKGSLQPPAKPSPERPQFSPRKLATDDAKQSLFNVSDVNQLQQILEVIDKAIDRARKRKTRTDCVPWEGTREVISNVKDAETVLDQVTQVCYNFIGMQTPVTMVANESYKVLRGMLGGVGNLHWAAAGLSMVAFVLGRMDMVETNAAECLTLLETMRDLGKHVVALYPMLLEQDKKLQRAVCLITEGAIFCCAHLNSGILNRFSFAEVNNENFLLLRDQITFLYPELNLTVSEAILARTTALLRQSSMPLSPHKPEYPTNKVGLDEKVHAVLQLLGMADIQGPEPGVRAVVLHGMGGIGKSTLGMALHARLPFTGRNHARVEIGECPTKEKIQECQKDIIDRLSDQKIKIGDSSEGRQKLGIYLKKCTAPILLLVDNIFNCEDLERLLPDSLVLPDGSRIIVTSRDASVCAVLEEKGVTCQPYPVAELKKPQAKELLCMQVFNGLPPPPNRERLVDDLLNICDGLPLALEVVGRYLRRHKSDRAWNLAIESLQECRPVSGKKEDQLYQSLMFSYNQLDGAYQEAFLDIACLLGDVVWDWVELIYGEKLVTLEELALVKKIHDGDGFVRLQVHDLLVALGRSIKLGSRIWSDGQNKLPPLLQEDDMGMYGIVEGLLVRNCSDLIHAEKLDAMHKSLRVLILQDVPVLGKCSKSPHHLQLCITTNGMPYKDLAKLEKLQVLIMSTLDQDQETDFVFENVEFPRHLKLLSLSAVRSLKYLSATLGELSCLQTLEIVWCENLQELPETFCRLQCLRTLILTSCGELKQLPRNFEHLLSLEILDLSYCIQLQELPDEFGQLIALRCLNLCGCKCLTKLPPDFSQLRSLEVLHLGQCESLEALPKGFGSLRCLQDLNLTRCNNLDQLPEGFEMLGALRALCLEHCHKLVMLPANFGQLYSLETLRLSDCTCLKELPASFLDLQRLSSLDVTGSTLIKNMSLLEELKQQQECKVVCENINPDFEYLESTDEERTLSVCYESYDDLEEHDFQHNRMYN